VDDARAPMWSASPWAQSGFWRPTVTTELCLQSRARRRGIGGHDQSRTAEECKGRCEHPPIADGHQFRHSRLDLSLEKVDQARARGLHQSGSLIAGGLDLDVENLDVGEMLSGQLETDLGHLTRGLQPDQDRCRPLGTQLSVCYSFSEGRNRLDGPCSILALLTLRLSSRRSTRRPESA
jgi:hypothetical protein